MPRLLLFDIDGTLIDTRGAGLSALLDAVEEVFRVDRETVGPLDLAGATDGGVVRLLLERLNQIHGQALTDQYLECYLRHLQARLEANDFSGILLPGVRELIQELREVPDVVLGLLTGNVRQGAMHKLTRFGLEDAFIDGAFGDDAEDRNHLGDIAIERFSKRLSHAFVPQEVLIIGDTEKDIACAEACGARCLAVATGTHSMNRLQDRNPWRCVDDLSDTLAIRELLVRGE